jgi:ATP-binding cassette subfamily G (WHITE) protein 2 (SNQ2)
MLLTRSKITAHDNSTRGLDSSTSVEYVRALRLATDMMHTTTIASLYQCAEAIYNLFDKVCLVSNGKCVFYGNTNEAVQYFKDLGFDQHFGQTSADFLVSVTDPKAVAVKEGAHPPKGDAGLVEAYQRSKFAEAERQARVEYRKQYSQDHQETVLRSREAEQTKRSGKNSGYVTNFNQQIRLAMTRRWQLLMGDISTYAIQ